jgi:2-methylcitrate dehydratase PrpD
MDALLQIVQEEDLHAHDVQEIRVRAGPNIMAPLRYVHPSTELEAKFSLQFGLACILVRRRAGLAEYTSNVVHDPMIRETMSKVKTILDTDIASMGVEKMRSILEVELHNHRVITRFIDSVRGTPEQPLQKHELYQKFCECATYTLSESRTNTVFDLIRNFENLSEIRQVLSLLTVN